MYISYFDESGDEGYPGSSPLFILTSVYMHYEHWRYNYDSIINFRRKIKAKYGLPVKQEFHTKEFITDKQPYHGLYSIAQRKNILFNYCHFMATLKIQAVNVVIDKTKIGRAHYDVLKNALTYNVQRIENTLKGKKYMIITDEGRLGKMRKTTRAIQRINFIPSTLYPGTTYRQEIKHLIEDPLPKQSDKSAFIQLSDTIAFVVSVYVRQNICTPPIVLGKRITSVLATGDDLQLMNLISV